MRRARGTFEVEMTPEGAGVPIGRMALSKTYVGDVSGEATGYMLSVMAEVEGSAAYVAIERVTAELDGRHGTFDLVHRGLMDRGQPSLDVVVAPDSGTGDLSTIRGNLTIDIVDGVHTYDFAYDLD